MFAAWGRIVYRGRWFFLVLSAVLLGVSVFGLAMGGQLRGNGQYVTFLESGRAQKLIADQIGSRNTGAAPGTSMLVLISSPSLTAQDPDFRSAVVDAVAPLRSDRRVVAVATPFDPGATPQQAAALTSSDAHTALVSVQLRDTEPVAAKYYGQLQQEVRAPGMKVTFTGALPIQIAFNSTLESDLSRAETVSLPVSLLLLLLIFGAVVAASLPLGVGALAIVGALAACFTLNRFTDVSQYALNIVSLIGLGVAIDYSLFVVNRYRDELTAGSSREDALAVTMATAGRAITFSGVTVAIGLAAMLFYQGTFMASMGAAGTIVVFIAVFYGLTFLPALLAVLGPNVDRLRVSSLLPRGRRFSGGFWRTLAQAVMRRPIVVLLPTLGVLIAAGIPFTQIRVANGDVDMLPPRLSARQGYDQLLRDFPGQDATSFTVVVKYASGDPLGPGRVGDLYDLSRSMAAIPGVTGVTGPLDLDPTLNRAGYEQLYAAPADQRPPAVQQVTKQMVGSDIVLLVADTNQPPTSDAARTTVSRLRALRVPGAQVLVTGQSAYDVDSIGYIVSKTPLAVAFVMVVTYLVLFLLTGSVVLPLKALVMNLLSVSASFGALVFIFQQGHFSNLLGFTGQPLDPSIPVILFSIVFGLSMDYEVLLVSRIQEEYRRTGDSRFAVAEGLQRSGRLITGAAAVMVAVFVAFGLAEVVIIKAIGIGLAIAVAIDATIVRALLVPAVMRLLGDANWWAPGPLRRLYRRAGLGELEANRAAAA